MITQEFLTNIYNNTEDKSNLWLRNCGLLDADMLAIANFLIANPTIKHLNLHRNNIRDKGITLFLRALTSNDHYLKTLNLVYNNITNQTVTTFVAYKGFIKKLTRLNLKENGGITYKSQKSLEALHRINPNLILLPSSFITH